MLYLNCKTAYFKILANYNEFSDVNYRNAFPILGIHQCYSQSIPQNDQYNLFNSFFISKSIPIKFF